MSKIHIETDQEYKDRIFDDLLKDSEILSRIKAVVNRDTRQHLIDIGYDKKSVDSLTVNQFKSIERNDKLTDIKLIFRFGYK